MLYCCHDSPTGIPSSSSISANSLTRRWLLRFLLMSRSTSSRSSFRLSRPSTCVPYMKLAAPRHTNFKYKTYMKRAVRPSERAGSPGAAIHLTYPQRCLLMTVPAPASRCTAPATASRLHQLRTPTDLVDSQVLQVRAPKRDQVQWATSSTDLLAMLLTASISSDGSVRATAAAPERKRA